MEEPKIKFDFLENEIVEYLVKCYQIDRENYIYAIEDCLKLLDEITQKRISGEEITQEEFNELVNEFKDIIRLGNSN